MTRINEAHHCCDQTRLSTTSAFLVVGSSLEFIQIAKKAPAQDRGFFLFRIIAKQRYCFRALCFLL